MGISYYAQALFSLKLKPLSTDEFNQNFQYEAGRGERMLNLSNLLHSSLLLAGLAEMGLSDSYGSSWTVVPLPLMDSNNVQQGHFPFSLCVWCVLEKNEWFIFRCSNLFWFSCGSLGWQMCTDAKGHLHCPGTVAFAVNSVASDIEKAASHQCGCEVDFSCPFWVIFIGLSPSARGKTSSWQEGRCLPRRTGLNLEGKL